MVRRRLTSEYQQFHRRFRAQTIAAPTLEFKSSFAERLDNSYGTEPGIVGLRISNLKEVLSPRRAMRPLNHSERHLA